MKKNLVIFGTAAMAQVVYHYFNEDSDYDVVAFTASEDSIEENSLFDLPVVPFESIETSYPADSNSMFIAVGYTQLNKTRESLYNAAKEKGYELATYIHSGVKIWGTNKVGDNTFIFEDNTIQPYVEIGNNIVLWSGNHIGHHSVIEDNCFISSHVVVSGACRIGANSFIGVNSTFRDGISIGKYNTLGAGCLMVKSTDDNKTFIGTKSSEYIKQ